MGFYSIHPDRLENGRPVITLVLRGTMNLDEATELMAQLRDVVAHDIGGAPCCVIVDHREQKTITAAARKVLADGAKNPLFYRIAFIGGSVFIRTLSRFIIRASGQEHKSRFFSDTEQALAWLGQE